MKTAVIILVVFLEICAGYGCFHVGYVFGYDAAIQWAKGVNFDQ